jgi:hypothetical protein
MMNLKKKKAREENIYVLENRNIPHYLHYRAPILPFYPQRTSLNSDFQFLTPSFFRFLPP